MTDEFTGYSSVEEAVGALSGQSEETLLRALKEETERKIADGELDGARIEAMLSELEPFLNGRQRERMRNVLKHLKE